jgi:hypothetical protein
MAGIHRPRMSKRTTTHAFVRRFKDDSFSGERLS